MPRIQEALESLVGPGHFSCLDLKFRFWQIKMDELLKQYTMFAVSNLCFFECDHMPFGLCNVPATFQRLMQNCLRELNLTYCLIYLDDIIIFLQTVEEHLHCLCIVIDQFREHNLKLKPSKCDFFRNKITYLAHQVWKDGVCPSNSNLKTITECTPLQTYTEKWAFLRLVGHYRRFIKGFVCIAQPLSEHSPERGLARSQNGCCSTRMPRRPSRYWTRCTWWHPSWCLLTTPNHSCWRLMHPKTDWGWCCHRSRQMGGITRALTPHKKNYHSMKVEFWHWSGQLQSTSKSICPTCHLWCRQIIICSHT